jgi:hypothetical protein
MLLPHHQKHLLTPWCDDHLQAIEEAIMRSLPRVEAGAQGEHKLQRGYLPNFTYSAHYIADPVMRSAVAKFLGKEDQQVRRVVLSSGCVCSLQRVCVVCMYFVWLGCFDIAMLCRRCQVPCHGIPGVMSNVTRSESDVCAVCAVLC